MGSFWLLNGAIFLCLTLTFFVRNSLYIFLTKDKMRNFKVFLQEMNFLNIKYFFILVLRFFTIFIKNVKIKIDLASIYFLKQKTLKIYSLLLAKIASLISTKATSFIFVKIAQE